MEAGMATLLKKFVLLWKKHDYRGSEGGGGAPSSRRQASGEGRLAKTKGVEDLGYSSLKNRRASASNRQLREEKGSPRSRGGNAKNRKKAGRSDRTRPYWRAHRWKGKMPRKTSSD